MLLFDQVTENTQAGKDVEDAKQEKTTYFP